MKNTLLKILTLIFALCMVVSVATACNGGNNTGDSGNDQPQHVHDYKTIKFDELNHWFECSCGEKSSLTSHAIVNNACVCGYVVEDSHTHDYTILDYNETAHWFECECGKKSGIENHKGGTATCTKKAVCGVCNQEYGEKLSHNYNELKYNETNHWYECACGAKNGLEGHKGGTATQTQKAVCSVCHQEYGALLIPEHTHTYSELKFDQDSHWHECVCGEKSAIETHKGGTATCTQKATCSICNQEYGEKLAHEYDNLKYDSNQHWYECDCGAFETKENHKGGTATCTKKAICTICGQEYGEKLAHEYDNLKYDSNQHWHECDCGAFETKENHKGGTATCTLRTICSVCVQEYGEKLSHNCNELKYDANQHWYECDCNLQLYKAEHSADDSGYCTTCDYVVGYTKGIIYDKSADGTYAEVIGYDGSSTKISIAPTYNNLPVKSIYKNAFKYTNITKVTIPNSVEDIGDWAFYWCDSLISIDIPDSVTSIGKSAFSDCDTLQSIEIGNSVTSIGDYAFSFCDSLTSIVLPNSVTSIGEGAFSWCGSLTSIDIPDSVTSIGEGAFISCYSLKSIDIPNSVTSIGESAFSYCYSLRSITFDGTKEEWWAIEKGGWWKENVPATKVQCIDGDIYIQ